MNASILFTHSYFLRFDPKQWKMQQPYPPLGTLYAAAVMREQGYRVELFDPMFSEDPKEIRPFLNKQPSYVVIYDDGFNYLTKMCLTNMREAAFRISALAVASGAVVIACSSDASDHYEKYLDHGSSFVIRGEGELTLKELVDAIENKKDLRTVEGIVYRENGETIVTKKRDVLREPDTLPYPAWDLVNMREYKSRWKKSSGYFSLNMSTTRGCPFHCNWCAKPIYGNRYHVHSPGHVVKELELLVKQYGATHIWMTDDIFGLKPGWVNEFASLVSEAKLKFSFKIQSRVDLLLQENNVEALARAGCETVWVGAESGSQKILDAMEKGTKVEQIFEATRLLKKHGIRPAFFLQFGYPGETREDIDATIRMVMELMPEDIGVSISYPLPGTPFYERVKNELKVKANWTDSDEMAMLFRNAYPAPFYKELQRYIHKRYRTQQGLDGLKSFFSSPVKMNASVLKRIAAIPFHYTGYLRQQNKLSKFGQPVSEK